MVRSLIVAASLVLLVSCAHGGRSSSRTFRMPLSAQEAPLVIPALGAAAEKLGYESSGYGQTGTQVTLADGSRLIWNAMNTFSLTIQTPRKPKVEGAPAEDLDAQFRALKVKADEVWDLAIELRQKNNVGAAMVVNPVQPPPAAQPMPQVRGFNNSFNGNNGGQWNTAPQAAPAAGQCRSSLDCNGGWCKDWRGQKVCMHEGGPGAPCSNGLDCASGLFCRGDTCG